MLALPQRRARRRAGRRRRPSKRRSRPSRETSAASGRYCRRGGCRAWPGASRRPTSSEDGHSARNLPKEPCSFATSWTKRAFTRTESIFAPLRTMRASLRSPSQNSSGSKASRVGSKPRKAASNPGHFDSITLQAKPAENTRFVISARMRSSRSLARAFGSGFGGMSLASASAPPFRFSARARIVWNGVTFASFFPIAASLRRDQGRGGRHCAQSAHVEVNHARFVLARRTRIPSLRRRFRLRPCRGKVDCPTLRRIP